MAAAIPYIPLILAGVGTAGKMLVRDTSADLQKKQIELQKQQSEIAAADTGIKRAQNLNEVIASNVAGSAAKNVSLASPSFKAINNAAFGKFQEDIKMDSLNLKGRLAYFDAESRNLDYQSMFGMFGDLVDFSQRYYDMRNFNKDTNKKTK